MKIYAVGWALLALFGFAGPVSSQERDGCIYTDCEGAQFGGGGCIPGWICPAEPIDPPAPGGALGPTELCLGSECVPVSYRADGRFVIAESTLSNGYKVMGWAGPCEGPIASCLGIWENAYQDLIVEARRANRAQRFIDE